VAEEVGVKGEEGIELVGVAEDGLCGQDHSLVSLQHRSSRGQQPAQVHRYLEELCHDRRRAQSERVQSRLDDGIESQSVEECRALLEIAQVVGK
jgi:hypothetical protein